MCDYVFIYETYVFIYETYVFICETDFCFYLRNILQFFGYLPGRLRFTGLIYQIAGSPIQKKSASAIATCYIMLFKTNYQQNRRESGVGVYQFSQIKSHTWKRTQCF